MTSPLEGVRILDLTQVQAGPSCTQLLAWLGADVIKIEEPGVGDRTRWERARDPDIDSFYFLVFNANKRSLTLNLKTDEGREIFTDLVKVSDIVVENFGPGRMESFGLGYDRLKETNSKIVYATIKGFGTYGPYSSFKSFEHIAQAMGGAMSANGEQDGEPLFVAPGVGDSGTGLHCAIGMLAALRQRDMTGEGQFVEVSMQDAVVNLMRIRTMDTLNSNEPVVRAGNRAWGGASMIYPCQPGGPDDYVALYIQGDAWDSMLALMGRADLIGDERYATDDLRKERGPEIEKIISSWTRTKTKFEILKEVTDLGIPCGAVQDTLEVLHDPHLRAREMVVSLDDPVRGEHLALGCPIKIRSNEVEMRPPPLLGQHSKELLTELLDMKENDLAELEAKGVI